MCRPMDHVIYDFIGKLRVSERGYCFILIMVCVMTRFVFLKPLRTKSAKEVAFTLVNVFANFGVPQILQSDNKQVMVADVLEELRKLLCRTCWVLPFIICLMSKSGMPVGQAVPFSSHHIPPLLFVLFLFWSNFSLH